MVPRGGVREDHDRHRRFRHIHVHDARGGGGVTAACGRGRTRGKTPTSKKMTFDGNDSIYGIGDIGSIDYIDRRGWVLCCPRKSGTLQDNGFALGIPKTVRVGGGVLSGNVGCDAAKCGVSLLPLRFPSICSRRS